jgi:hypothetical protein
MGNSTRRLGSRGARREAMGRLKHWVTGSGLRGAGRCGYEITSVLHVCGLT